MKHAAWLVSALVLAGVADETDAWVYDPSARPSDLYSTVCSGPGALETRSTASSSSVARDLESRIASQESSGEGRLDSRPPVGIYLILR